jgi:cytoplasmic iron level regulating protein YaaA (DUF328/UPF0246 family)
MSNEEATKTQPKEAHFFIDKKKFETERNPLSVREILVDFAKEDPILSTLAQRRGNQIHKFTNLDEEIFIENGERFTVLHNEPTTVS